MQRAAPRRRIWPIIRTIWIAAGLGFTAVFVVWSLIAYRANADAVRAAAPDSAVAVSHADGVWQFTPKLARPTGTTLVFFPGAMVDSRAYAPIARAVAERGYP